MAKIAEIRKEYRPKIEKAREGACKGILTDDQKKAREEALKAGKKRKEVVESLKLTDEQKEKVQTVGKEVTHSRPGRDGKDPGRPHRRSRKRSSRS